MRTDATSVVISAAVEGEVDEAVARKLVRHVGGQLGAVYGKGGKPSLLEKLEGYDNAGRRFPWFVLVDLDSSLTTDGSSADIEAQIFQQDRGSGYAPRRGWPATADHVVRR